MPPAPRRRRRTAATPRFLLYHDVSNPQIGRPVVGDDDSLFVRGGCGDGGDGGNREAVALDGGGGDTETPKAVSPALSCGRRAVARRFPRLSNLTY